MKMGYSEFTHLTWGLFHLARAFRVILVLSWSFFLLSASGPNYISGMECNFCGSYTDNYDVGLQNIFLGDTRSGSGNHKIGQGHEIVCSHPNLFCFPSTLLGLSSKDLKSEASFQGVYESHSTQAFKWASNSSQSSDYAMYELREGRNISCSLISIEAVNESLSIQNDNDNETDISSCRGPSLNHKGARFLSNTNCNMFESGSFDGSSSAHIDISPPMLDWGKKYLYSPSVAFLTIANTCNDSILHVDEPFSTNSQFYPCNFSEVSLGPGEVASLCFVFLPRSTGLSTTDLILQTSIGGFLIRAKGFGIESPYDIHPVVDLEISSRGRWRTNLSFSNPFDEILYVEEVTAWISVHLENTSRFIEAFCSQDIDEFRLWSSKDWLVVNSDQIDQPLMAMKPHRSWEITPRHMETIIEMDFAVESEGKYFGAFYVKLLRSSQNISDTVMVPLEAELRRKETYDTSETFTSVSLDTLIARETGEIVFVAISLRNVASFPLRIIKISEVTDEKHFEIKYTEGLLLFPGTITKVAVITCHQLLVELENSPPEVSGMNRNCHLQILTNDSSNPQIGVPCQVIIDIYARHQKNSYIGYNHQPEDVESGSIRTMGSQFQLPPVGKILKTAEADELVLRNWKSQGTSTGLSVLDVDEVLFSIVQVGGHSSKWITVKNPSHQPVLVQLVLNSGEIIDECKSLSCGSVPPSSGIFIRNESVIPVRCGFSIASDSVIESYIQPYGKASIGPVFFHPSSRREWRSSALIRNNLSGVEWLSLSGFGGSLSLVVLEGSEPVQIVYFNLNLPVPFNISSPDTMFDVEDVTRACSRPYLKMLHVKNTGDLPVEVGRIKISGTECGLDGFVIHACKGFSLEPGESMKLSISYQADFSAAMVHRDLELSLATGILVIPIKASLSDYMLNMCEKSMFWVRVKKFSVALLAASLVFLAICCIVFQAMALGPQNYIFKGGKNPILTNNGRNSLHVHFNQKDSGCRLSCKMDNLLESVMEDKNLMFERFGRFSDHPVDTADPVIDLQYAKPTLENESNASSSNQRGKALPSSILSNSVAVENLDAEEASQHGKLTVRTGKEKGRRRRKRKGAGAGLAGLVEVSSSQSGNSTPSSPLSPISSVIPKRMLQLSPDGDLCIETMNPFTRLSERQNEKSLIVASASKLNKMEPEASLNCCTNNCSAPSQQQHPSPRKSASRPALLPSAGRPVTNVLCPSPFLADTSKVAPYARAPGSKLYNQKTVKTEEKEKLDVYRYDIWGDHFSGFRPMGLPKDDPVMSSKAIDSNSSSFFVKGPQSSSIHLSQNL